MTIPCTESKMSDRSKAPVGVLSDATMDRIDPALKAALNVSRGRILSTNLGNMLQGGSIKTQSSCTKLGTDDGIDIIAKARSEVICVCPAIEAPSHEILPARADLAKRSLSIFRSEGDHFVSTGRNMQGRTRAK